MCHDDGIQILKGEKKGKAECNFLKCTGVLLPKAKQK
jgi:hypothetical protein